MDFLKVINEITPVLTSHNVGDKRVLFSRLDADTPITQIAKTSLSAGTNVNAHVHQTMDEHFIILKGKCIIEVEGISNICEDNTYLYVPAKSNHQIKVIDDTDMITIGVALD